MEVQLSEKTTEITEGAVVRLKSGSSRMTVEIFDGSEAKCVWHKDGIAHSENYRVSSLITEAAWNAGPSAGA